MAGRKSLSSIRRLRARKGRAAQARFLSSDSSFPLTSSTKVLISLLPGIDPPFFTASVLLDYIFYPSRESLPPCWTAEEVYLKTRNCAQSTTGAHFMRSTSSRHSSCTYPTQRWTCNHSTLRFPGILLFLKATDRSLSTPPF